MPADSVTRKAARRLRLTIDGQAVAVPEGTSVLRAAELAGLYVPSLCAHRELSPFGGCRLCAVEIAGVPGQPLACSTQAYDGMDVTTDGEALRETRREILQLLLSAHPSSCLFCDDAQACARSQATIRKAGVSTGCRSCPADGDCELQHVVGHLGVTEIEYPITYRGYPPEHDDPFFDRDYNICILCGRCVRMCHEVRGASVLAFNYRSRRVKIGPAFGRSHVEAGCEFCGACVSVCPTGALSNKVSKWDGKPDGVETSTCPFCGLGCQLELRYKSGSLSEARGAHDAELNDGQLCVRGRFCLPEVTHNPSRARKPMLRRGRFLRAETWDVALDEVAERLAACEPGELLMLVSPDLSNEGLYAAQRFAREGMRSAGIDSTAGDALPGGPEVWSRLFSLPISLRALGEADAVICAGLASRYSFSVAGVQARRAMRRGARLVVVDARESSLARAADVWVPAAPGTEAAVLTALLEGLGGGRASTDGCATGRSGGGAGRGLESEQRHAAARLLDGAETLAVVVGPRVFCSLGADRLPAALEVLAAREGVTVLPLACGANIRGALELGALAGVCPGPRPAKRSALTLEGLRDVGRPKILYLVGEAPFASRPDCDYLVAQDLTLPPYDVDAFLPAASFAEAEGTLTNLEGRVQELHPVEPEAADAVRGYARPDWWAFSELAGRLRRPALQYASAADVRASIRAELPGFPADGDRSPRRMTPLSAAGRFAAREGVAAAPAGTGRFVIIPVAAAFRHRGTDLADVVEGLGELHLEEGLRMNPGDVARLGVEPGGAVTVAMAGRDLVLAARTDPACPQGGAYITYTPVWDGPVAPVRARVSAGDRSRRSRRPPSAAVRGLPGGEHAEGG